MIIETAFDIEQRVTWFSDDYQRQLTGAVAEIAIEIDPSEAVIETYFIECDEEIKSSTRHVIRSGGSENLRSIS